MIANNEISRYLWDVSMNQRPRVLIMHQVSCRNYKQQLNPQTHLLSPSLKDFTGLEVAQGLGFSAFK
jgi:hypothetical protein